jgi:HSP20 family protein
MVLVKRAELPVKRRVTEFDDLRNRMMRLFDDPFAMPMFRDTVGFTPPVQITETEGEMLVTAELPGMKKEEVEIELENNILTLRGEKKEEHEEKEKESWIYERIYGSFQRSFTLPVPIEETKIFADFQDGILRIRLPKSEKARGRKIPIG